MATLLCFFLNFQEYHNLRAAAFNSQARELSRRTDDLADSRSKYSILSVSCGGASVHPLGVVPEIRADCCAAGSDLSRRLPYFAFF